MKLMKTLFQANFFTAGLAMFAMFFGSGNLIFPVGIGRIAGEQNIWAMSGLFVTAILVPFSGLCLMLLYNGQQKLFFSKIGALPGKLVALLIIALIGPFGVLPRCIAFSYATFSIYFENVGITVFSAVSVALIYLFSFKKSDVVGLIGNVLTPILLLSLAVVIGKGIYAEPVLIDGADLHATAWQMVKFGFIEGYKTFDIFAALFFASAIIPSFKNVLGEKIANKKELFLLALKSSLVGIVLLFSVYVGLSYVAVNLRGALGDIPGEKLLGIIATLTMGKTAGLLANSVVFLACLTTAISLAVVSAEYFKSEIFRDKLSYIRSLQMTLAITFIFSIMGFEGIMRMVLPVLMVLCPAVIALMVANALNSLVKFPYVKLSFYVALLISLVVNLGQ